MSKRNSNNRGENKVEEPAIEYGISLTPTEIRNRARNYFVTQSAVKRVWLFGSFARGDQDENSDVDILIDVPREQTFTLFDLAEIQHVLQEQLHRKVDLAMIGALRDAFRKNIAYATFGNALQFGKILLFQSSFSHIRSTTENTEVTRRFTEEHLCATLCVFLF